MRERVVLSSPIMVPCTQQSSVAMAEDDDLLCKADLTEGFTILSEYEVF